MPEEYKLPDPVNPDEIPLPEETEDPESMNDQFTQLIYSNPEFFKRRPSWEGTVRYFINRLPEENQDALDQISGDETRISGALKILKNEMTSAKEIISNKVFDNFPELKKFIEGRIMRMEIYLSGVKEKHD